MKPSKPVKLNPKSRSFHHEVNAVAEQAGLELEDKTYPELMYYKDTITGRRFRVTEDLYLEVSDDNFDRWANSGLARTRLPTTDILFLRAIDVLRETPDES